MKKIIIVSPHFPPSNLAAVHRSRVFANHLASLGWEPIIVTVHEDYYEEKPDHNLEKLLPAGLRIEKVKAMKVSQHFRLIGDIGLRGYFQMRKRIIELIKKEKADFLYITIPSFYAALLGRAAYNKTGIPYGIDYIDPWVHQFPGSDKIFSRHWLSTKLAGFLEPIAVKHASLISGVAEGYYKDVLIRNPELKCQTLAMPYGGESGDYELVEKMNISPYLFTKRENTIDFVYAGAMLPKAYEPLRAMFRSIKENKEIYKNTRFHFIGTGKTPNDTEGYNIRPIAEEFGLWNSIVFEYPQRFPYLDVLIHLKAADGIFILGSTEPHYTPSKVYQAVLSRKPILALLHEKSTACEVIERSGAGKVLSFNESNCSEVVEKRFTENFSAFIQWSRSFRPTDVDEKYFEQYSARNITKQLVETLDKIIKE